MVIIFQVLQNRKIFRKVMFRKVIKFLILNIEGKKYVN